MLTLADSNFFSQFNMSDYGTYIFNRVKSLVDVHLENKDVEISKLIDSLQQVALRFLMSSQTYEMFTPANILNEDDLMVRRLNDHFLLLDRSLLISLTQNNRKRHILSGSSTQDAFSTIGQHIEISRITGEWNQTISAVENLTQMLTEATLTLRVGE
ncbi:uncharacterized protein LOC135479442 [Liolophura sinensis]|uniref:uncharacterized protein LOC135479442 n=1 Tax=Liolophura sinensis TaxID=3198878 RepID=UPI003158DE5D